MQSSPVPLTFASDEALGGVRLRTEPAWVRVRRGVYAPRAAWEALAPWERYLARVHAASAQHPGALFAFESAAALHGLPIFGEPRDVHLIDDAGGKSRRYGDLVIHSTRRPPHAADLGTVWATGIRDTALGLARVLPPAYGLAVVDAGLRRVGETAARWLAVAQGHLDQRGRRRARWVLDRATPRSESVGESVSRAVIEWLGFPDPELQVVFPSPGFADRVDFFWRSVRAIGESDGFGKYDRADIDATTRALVDEKRREDRLRRQVDGFARWDWADTMRAAPLAAALTAAGLDTIRAPHRAALATLRHHPRSWRHGETRPPV